MDGGEKMEMIVITKIRGGERESIKTKGEP